MAPALPTLGGSGGYGSSYLNGLVEKYEADPSGANRKDLRNEIVGGCIALIDAEFVGWLTEVGQSRQDQSLTLDVIDLGADLVGAAVPAASTKAFWTVISGMASGTRQAIDKGAFFDKSMPALVSAMQAERVKIGERIAVGLGKPDKDYCLLSAFHDVWDYYAAGTLVGAVHSVAQDAGKKQERANEEREVRLDVEQVQAEAREHQQALLLVAEARGIDAATVAGLLRAGTGREHAFAIDGLPPAAVPAELQPGLERLLELEKRLASLNAEYQELRRR